MPLSSGVPSVFELARSLGRSLFRRGIYTFSPPLPRCLSFSSDLHGPFLSSSLYRSRGTRLSGNGRFLTFKLPTTVVESVAINMASYLSPCQCFSTLSVPFSRSCGPCSIPCHKHVLRIAAKSRQEQRRCSPLPLVLRDALWIDDHGSKFLFSSFTSLEFV